MAEPKQGGKNKLLLIIVGLIIAIAGATALFLTDPSNRLFSENTFGSVTGRSYSPIYACLQKICVIAPPSWNKVYTYASNSLQPPDPPANATDLTLGFTVVEPKKYNIIEPDEKWSSAKLSEFVKKINSEGLFFAN